MEYNEFEKMISGLDIRIFDRIPSQTTASDKRSLLFLQRTVRDVNSSYVYLEIGSHLGGSIQPYLPDRKCIKIYSIDKRPPSQPDERSDSEMAYPGNTTERMLRNLKNVADDVSKLTCLDGDVASINTAQIEHTADICLIDGEHTNSAVVKDFRFCKSVLSDDGIIIFHDANVVSGGLKEIIRDLRGSGERFRAYYFSTSIFALVFGSKYKRLERLRVRSCIARAKMLLSGVLPEPIKVAVLKISGRYR